jgi:hypothetical protein
MRRFCFLLLVFLSLPLPLKAADDPDKKIGDLYVVGIGQEEEWNFLPEGFEKIFRDQGKAFYRDMHSRVLLGKKATRKELLASVEWMCENAKENDLAILFIACHGICTAEGESVFSTRDGDVRPREIKKILAKLPCHAIVVNDACQSGNWPKEFPVDPMPANVTALCCCQSTQNSETEFDITLFEALYGKADYNNDGVVDLDEVIKYCGLRIKEVQGGRLTLVLQKAKDLKGAVPLTKVAPKLVDVLHKGEMWSALVEKEDGDDYTVRIIGWDSKPGSYFLTNSVTRENICLPKDGPALLVEQKGRWRPACQLGRDGEDYKIRYLGSKREEDVVKQERVYHLFAGKPGEKYPLAAPTRKDPFLGISGNDNATQCAIKEVVEGSPAAKAGLKADDVIVAFAGEKIGTFADLAAVLARRKIGDKVAVEVQRGQETVKLDVTLDGRPN